MLWVISIFLIVGIGMIFYLAFLESLIDKEIHIDPDPMEYRVKDIKARILEMEKRIGKEIETTPIMPTYSSTNIRSEADALRAKLSKKSF